MKFLGSVIALCGSFKSYRKVRDIPVTASFRYLAQLIAILALVLLLSRIPWMLERVGASKTWADEYFPPFIIQNGQISTSVQQPYYAGNDDFLFILDTTGEVTEADPKAMNGILLMADSFIFWRKTAPAPDAQIQSQQQSLKNFPDGSVDGNYVLGLIRTSLLVALPFILLIVALVGLLTCLLQAYLFSVIASYMERHLPRPLHFQQLLNIAIHAVTPGAIIATTYTALWLRGLNLWIIYLIAYGIYLIGATNACRDELPVKEANNI